LFFCAISRIAQKSKNSLDNTLKRAYNIDTNNRSKQQTGKRAITMSTNEKIAAAVEIFKAKMASVHGKFRAYVSEANANEVDIFSDEGLYCTINIRSRMVKGI